MLIFCISFVSLFFQSICKLELAYDSDLSTNLLARIQNKVQNLNLNLQPVAPYQTIDWPDWFYHDNTVTIRNSMAGVINSTSYCFPTIFFHRFRRRVDYRSALTISLSIRHTVLKNLKGTFAVKLVLTFKNSSSAPAKGYFAQFILTRNQYSCSGALVSLPGQTLNFRSKDNVTYCLETSNNGSFTGVFDIDSYISHAITNNLVSQNDLLDKFEIIGEFASGSYETKIDYNVSYNKLVYLQAEPDLYPSSFKYYFTDLQKKNGLTLLGQTSGVQRRDPKFTFTTYSTNYTTVKANFATKLGQNYSYGTYEYFPLNTSLQMNYPVSLAYNLSCIDPPCKSSLCFFIKYIARSVRICQQDVSELQPSTTFIQSMNYTDANSKTNFTFDLYQTPNTTSTKPYLYFFVPQSAFNYQLDLLFFAKWLVAQNRVNSTQDIVEFDRSIKIYSGNGTISEFPNTAFPDCTQIRCTNTSLYFNLSVCTLCQMSGCLTCLTKNRCFACNATDLWVLYRQACRCQLGYCIKGLKLDAICITTPLPGCLTCSDSTICIGCDPEKFWILDSVTNITCICMDGYYQFGIDVTSICKSCEQPGCVRCINQTVCTLCSASKNWVLSGDTCICNVGYYKNTNSSPTCSLCMDGCLDCTTSSVCSTCNTSLNWVLDSSACICPSGYCQSGSGIGAACLQTLLSGCNKCFSQVACSACRVTENWVLNATSSVCECNSGYYQVGVDVLATCEPCVTGCLKCTDSVTCITCNDPMNWMLNSSTLLCECKPAYYLLIAGASTTCQSCGSGCLSCLSSSQCQVCDTSSNWLLNGSICNCKQVFFEASISAGVVCQACSMAGCLQCTSTTKCITCDTDSNFVLSRSVCICQKGYCLQGSGAAAQCISTVMSGCIGCSSSTLCTSCNATDRWTLDTPNCKCQLNFYQVGIDIAASCQPCLPGCVQCPNSTSCSLCNLSLNLSLNTSSLVCECLPTLFQVLNGTTISCVPCALPGCLKCLNTSFCTLCDTSWELSNSICICANTFYASAAKTCTSCGKGCLQCKNGSVCDICDDGSHWEIVNDAVNSTVYCGCMNGYMEEEVGNQIQCLLLNLQGCISYSNSDMCIQCDSYGNWILNNGRCSCPPGHFINKTDTKAICSIILQTKRSLSCLFLDQGVTFDNCLTAPLSAKTKTIMGATSTPNLGMLLSISQISGLIDDFTFYVYLKIKYGQEFDTLVRFMWNLTNQRWIPSHISSFYYDIQDKYNDQVQVKDTSLIPHTWSDLNEGSAFIANTRDFWIGSIPCGSVMFIIIHLIYRLLAYFKFKISAKLLNFKWFSILVLTIFIQNLQVLSFRTFQQILYGGPPSIQPFSSLFVLNEVVCYTTFFFVSICACAGHYILRILIGMNIQFTLQLVTYNNQSMFFLSITQFFKILYGFINASYNLEAIVKIGMLFVIQCSILATIVFFRKSLRLKSMFTLLVGQYIMRLLVNIFILARTICMKFDYKLSQLEDETLGNFQITIMIVLFCAAVLQIPTAFLQQNNQTSKINNIKKLNILVFQMTRNPKKIVKQKTKAKRPKKILRFKLENSETSDFIKTSKIFKQKTCRINQLAAMQVVEKQNLFQMNEESEIQFNQKKTCKTYNTEIHAEI